MVTMFINTLPPPFYDKAVGSVASNFVDPVKESRPTSNEEGLLKLATVLASSENPNKKGEKGKPTLSSWTPLVPIAREEIRVPLSSF
ncbi:hypothetical protein CR513_29209, partial [Mucuna pruriens]